MAREGIRVPFDIDWFNVTYRSVALGVVGIALLVVGGFYLYNLYAYGPRQEAAEAISRATRAVVRAEALQGGERLEEIRANARAALGEARSEFEARAFDNARIAAIRSENLSQQAIDLARGDKDSARKVRFYRIEGEVRVKRVGEFAWEPANRRMLLEVGDQVKTTSSASAQLIYFDGTVTTIEPGSLLEIKDLYEDPVTKVRRVREKLNWGELMASTQKRNVEGSFHEVTTDAAAARSQDAGKFRVAIDKKDGAGAFDVFEGRIEVSTPKKRENVVAGERIRSNPKGQLSEKQALPGVPRLVTPSDQKVFVHEDPSKIKMTLSWEEVAGAQRYQLQISKRPLFTETVYDAQREDTSVVIDGVQAGDYYWRVAAVNRAGANGPFSSARRFRVSSQVIRDRADNTPPTLEIAEFVPVGSMLIINGTTEPGASLWIDNEKVGVSEDGTFYSVVRLRSEGLNEIRFVAQDNAGNETTITRSAYVEMY